MSLLQIVRAVSSRLISWLQAAAYQAFRGKPRGAVEVAGPVIAGSIAAMGASSKPVLSSRYVARPGQVNEARLPVTAKPELRPSPGVSRAANSRLTKGGPPMRLLLTTAALGALMAASSAVPASAQQSKDCGKYGMTCAPMAKSPNYT